MKPAMARDLIIEIKKTWNRFLSIFAIVLLGVGFITGIKATSPAMKYTADLYFDQQNFIDFQLFSTYGFTESDLQELEKQQGIAEVDPVYTLDVLLESSGGIKTVRVHSLDGQGDTGINRPVLLEGSWPAESGQCVIDYKQAGVIGEIGSTVLLSRENSEETLEMLKTDEYVITGYIKSPEYISYATRGAISIGQNAIFCFFYIPESDFQSDYYTNLLVTVEGAKDLQSYSDEYDNFMVETGAMLESFADEREEIRNTTYLAEVEEELNKNRSDLADAKTSLDEAKLEAEVELDNAWAEIVDAREQIASGYKELETAETQLANEKSSGYAQIDKAYKELETAQAELDKAWAAYEKSKAEFDEKVAEWNALSAAEKLLMSRMEDEIEAARTGLEDTRRQLTAKQSEIDQKYDEVDSSKASLAQEIAAARRDINNGSAELSRAETELSEAEAEYQQAQEDANTEITDAEEEIAEAEEEIEKAEREIAQLEPCTWYVLSRQENLDYVNFGADINRINALTSVFPVFFYLIAALICLTTITRMVEEQRNQIGVLRALGYSKSAIASKYLIYAGIASMLGSAAGLMVGHRILPTVIYRTYETTYTLVPLSIPFDIPYSAAASLLAILITMFAALWACHKEVGSVPSELLRAKSPLPGNRVFLEKIPFIWNRLSFLLKVTVRNLFRYKKRFFMTVLGIGGCTALILTGFGVKDSVSGSVPRQFYELHSYHLFINLISPGSSADESVLNSNLQSLLGDAMYVTEIPLEVEGLEDSSSIYLFIPEDAEKTADFIDFHDRRTGNQLTFPMNGKVIVTEKLAIDLGLEIGDQITFKLENSEFISSEVGGITENYVYNYIFMTAQDYADAFGSAVEFDYILGKVPDVESMSLSAEQELVDAISDQENVLSVTMIPSIRREFDNVMNNLNAMVLVIILSACLLAFVVLYNLTNINITERSREIATIKVLGFNNGEVSAYINREVIVLTLFGILLGLVGGIFLHRFTIQTAEVDMLMYIRDIKPMSFLLSTVLTVLFSFIVNIMIQFKLRRINMVESLKSVD